MLSVEQPKLCPVFSTGYCCYRIESVNAIQSLQFHHLLSSWNLGNKHVKHIRLHEPLDGADNAWLGCWFATAHFDVLVILLRELLSPNFRPQASFLVQDLGSRVNHATGQQSQDASRVGGMIGIGPARGELLRVSCTWNGQLRVFSVRSDVFCLSTTVEVGFQKLAGSFEGALFLCGNGLSIGRDGKCHFVHLGVDEWCGGGNLKLGCGTAGPGPSWSAGHGGVVGVVHILDDGFVCRVKVDVDDFLLRVGSVGHDDTVKVTGIKEALVDVGEVAVGLVAVLAFHGEVGAQSHGSRESHSYDRGNGADHHGRDIDGIEDGRTSRLLLKFIEEGQEGGFINAFVFIQHGRVSTNEAS